MAVPFESVIVLPEKYDEYGARTLTCSRIVPLPFAPLPLNIEDPSCERIQVSGVNLTRLKFNQAIEISQIGIAGRTPPRN